MIYRMDSRCCLSIFMFDWEQCFGLSDQLVQEQWKKTVPHLKVFMINLQKTYPLVMTNIAMEAIAHRNSWFSQLETSIYFGDFPYVSHNQMV